MCALALFVYFSVFLFSTGLKHSVARHCVAVCILALRMLRAIILVVALPALSESTQCPERCLANDGTEWPCRCSARTCPN